MMDMVWNQCQRTKIIKSSCSPNIEQHGKTQTKIKVFKMKKSQVKGGKLKIDKRHVLKGDATTFKLHPGTHQLQILVNGQVHAQNSFELLA